MSTYTIRRILLIFPTLLVASILVAAIVRALPGDAVMMTASEQFGARQLSEEGTAIARARMGLDQPFHVQYIRFILGWPKRDGRIRRTQDGGAIWKKLLPVEIEPATSVEFITNPVGWAAGGRYIFGTILGGTLWGPQKIADHNINALAFADEKRVWAVGDKGMVLHTSNGGQMIDEGDKVFNTWLNQDSGTDQPLRDIFVVDALTVWTVGDKGTILSTVDGGVTWERQANDTDANLLSVAFLDANNGLAVGEKGTILRTTNGGLTWSAGTGGGEGNLSGVAFGGSSKSWAVGKGGLLLQSSDGGVTWSPRVVSFQDDSGKVEELRRDLTSVAFANEKEGFVGGARGTFLATVDGGITWQVHDAGTTRSITDVSVITTSRGQVRAFTAASERFWEWGTVGGNMGKSLIRVSGIAEDLTRTFPPTFQLMLMTVILSTLVAMPVGILSAVRQDTWPDYTARFIMILGLAIPSFWLAVMVLLLPAQYFDWVPPLQYVSFFDDPLGNLKYFAIPSLVAGIFGSASVMRMTRSMMLEVLRQDYIRTAWSKGLRERVVIYRHALKNALIPVITIIGMQIPFLLGNQVIIESVFNIPGQGQLLLEAVALRDYTLIQGINLFLAAFIVVANLLVDLTYGWLDPRIRYD